MANPVFAKGEIVWLAKMDDHYCVAEVCPYADGYYYELDNLNGRPSAFGAWEWELANP